MTIDQNMNAYGLAHSVYAQQLSENNGSIDTGRYFWKLGENVIKQLRRSHIANDGSQGIGETLFGIQIKYDIVNPNNLQLFKDVTR